MIDLPIHWSDGLLVRPQHFQSWDRYANERFRTATAWDHPFGYGWRSLHFSAEALENGRFEVISGEARLRDGTPVVLESQRQPTQLLLADQARVSTGAERDRDDGAPRTDCVVLAVPRLRMGMPNVARTAGDARYVVESRATPDESRGDREQSVELLRLNVRLHLADRADDRYDTLPVAKVFRTGDRATSYALADDYCPPLLNLHAWPPLRDLLRALHDLVRARVASLTREISSRGITWQSDQPGDSERLQLLRELNSATVALGIMADTPGMHPFDAYRQLAQLVGNLAIFDPARQTPDVPRYDHDNLAPTFRELKQRIVALMNAVSEYPYEKRMFVRIDRGMKVDFEPRWLESNWQWYLGVEHLDSNADECLSLLARVDWKLGSGRRVDEYFQARAPALELKPVRQVPRALPVSGRWLYYQIGRDSDAWQDVRTTQTLAFRISEHAIAENAIAERGRRVDNGEIAILDQARGVRQWMRFALFAVPGRL